MHAAGRLPRRLEDFILVLDSIKFGSRDSAAANQTGRLSGTYQERLTRQTQNLHGSG